MHLIPDWQPPGGQRRAAAEARIRVSQLQGGAGLHQSARRAGGGGVSPPGDPDGVGQGDRQLVDPQDRWAASQRLHHGGTHRRAAEAIAAKHGTRWACRVKNGAGPHFYGQRSHWRDRVCIIRSFRMLAGGSVCRMRLEVSCEDRLGLTRNCSTDWWSTTSICAASKSIPQASSISTFLSWSFATSST